MVKRGRPRGSHDVTPQIRGGLKRYFKMLEDKGKSVSDIWRELFEKDAATAMRLAISIMPKELDITTTDISPEEWLEIMADKDDDKPESTESTGSLSGQLH
jgi:hypothetical protein